MVTIGMPASVQSYMRKAFTLIELLVVIAIIAVLAAILFPVFARAKGKARQVQCVSNLKQIGIAIGLYMSDSDDLFPAALDPSDKYVPTIWAGQPQWQAQIASMPLMSDALQPYIKSKEIFHCPSDIGTETLDNQFPTPFKSSPSMFATYGSSYFLRTEIVFRSFTQTSFDKPANVNLMMDGAGHWHGGGRAVEPGDDISTLSNLLHDYRYNVLYGDFHVKNISRGDLDQLWATPIG